MRKKLVACALVMALAAASATTAFAYGSTTTGGTSSSSSGGSSSGSSIGHAYDPSGATGTTVNGTSGSASGANVTFFSNTNAAATAGLPAATVEQINGINSGANLAQTITNVEANVNLEGYNALGTTHAAVVADSNGAAVATTASITLYVPNLTSELGTVQVLFYNNNTGRWELLNPTGVDAAAKTVVVNIPNSGTLAVVYKN